MTLKIKNIQTFKVNKKKQNKTKQKNKQKKKTICSKLLCCLLPYLLKIINKILG